MAHRNDILPHIPALRCFALGLTKNRDWADDLVQNCLERALGRMHLFRFGKDKQLKSWLFTMMRNLYLNEVSSARHRYEVSVDPMESWITGGRHDDAEARTSEEGIERLDMERAFAQMKDDHREILCLIVLEGYSYEETAQILKTPKGTVMSRLSRARAQLANILQGENETKTGPKTQAAIIALNVKDARRKK